MQGFSHKSCKKKWQKFKETKLEIYFKSNFKDHFILIKGLNIKMKQSGVNRAKYDSFGSRKAFFHLSL